METPITSTLAVGMSGYRAGLTGRRSVLGAVVLIVFLGAVITLVVDLDRPRRGFLTVSQQPLIDLIEQIGPPSPCTGSPAMVTSWPSAVTSKLPARV